VLPDIPAIAETPGLEGFESDLWYGFLAPAKTPPAIIDKIYKETHKMLSAGELKTQFEPQGADLVATSPAVFAKTIKADLAKWGSLIKSANIKPDK
jgi:tripartite-type tricarboxylate transporter receptor subunit TctC